MRWILRRTAADTAARDRAVVLGGSIAGTLAARVLADSFREVLVVDRDKVLGVTDIRRSTPHTVHAHGLHARGYLILSELFPGLLDEARSVGLPVRDVGKMRWYFDARPIRPADTGLLSIAGSRPILENLIRSRVNALPNVRYRESTEVLGLSWSADGSRVTGVRLRNSDAASGAYQIAADLVIDATGRGSRTPAWLAELGYERPPEERLKIGLTYTTCTFRRRPGTFDGPTAINPVASPAHPRGAFFGQTATGDCRLSLTGISGDRPPTDPDGFMAYVRSLPVPDIYQAVVDAERTGEPTAFAFPASLWRHYERLRRLPRGLVVLGDAAASFNPVYGQGMSVAAMQVMALRDQLARHPEPAPRQIARQIARIITDPWRLSTTGDLDFPGVTARRSLWVRVRNGYFTRLQYAMSKDPQVTAAFMRVAGLVHRPRRLWRPGLVARVLWHARDWPGSPPPPTVRTPSTEVRTPPTDQPGTALPAGARPETTTAAAAQSGGSTR
ncbi:FAD-dependent oxidoreductase [Micromonospora sp. WMMD1082]|uniref:FAD-dependent oxidoreductase n=1 Tax=Micromonospora sp. WMMD1082 TaxID=3016104 RepID=UPI0024176CC2|nr:FAD-dependent oxidoreductase [Micromonospora sp. WMMD1082]MDG4792780.1 FAD-binding monooxygenase [Micromonospora sp. WMMD1082]